MNKYDEKKAYERAKKKLEAEKGFYSHAVVYVLINIAIYFFVTQIFEYAGVGPKNSGVQYWMQWQRFLTPALWGIGLLIHGLCVFGDRTIFKKYFKNSIYSKDWEERKIKEFMNNDKF
ncbi:2TM domain-containing protein [Aquimarina sp. 2201CG1-2-11]|uniref:2TM domain-containing protein n=1 Tax=Aquimarina discodermiae TaxID=3231043 RepID=UPI0034626918